LLGPREVRRDIGTRLFRFRGDIDAELRHYHPRGDRIVRAFVRGVNAYIAMTERNPDLLPIEFRLLGTRPQPWTPEVVISRHQGLLGNIGQELNYGRAVAHVGAATVRRLSTFGPGQPRLALDPAIDAAGLADDILGLYNAFRRPIRFRPEDLAPRFRNDEAAFTLIWRAEQLAAARRRWTEAEDIGSNNWVVAGTRTQRGSPIMANDPHRAQSAPSLRYWVHLVGPGWNVIGGGEPEIPGVSIGHNAYGAWGLTVFATDGEDLYVYDTNPDRPNQYRYRGAWVTMEVVRDTIPVRGGDPVVVDLRYTRHGPVVYQDSVHHRAYAVRAAWMEIGGAPYLASLRMDQARDWAEFREASSYSHIPGENMVWADRAGTIGWQAVGIAPIRSNWDGLVPVPGDGRYEWDGFLPIKEKPHATNPPEGFIATANNDLIPPGYPHRNAVGFVWSDPFRWARATEVLASGRRHSMADMMRLQTDQMSIPARTLVPLLRSVHPDRPDVDRARRELLGWDFVLGADSRAAAIYVAWERRLQANMYDRFVPAAARPWFRRLSMRRIIDWLLAPPGAFGEDPLAGRDAMLGQSLEEAVDGLRERLGSDLNRWRYGDPRYKHALVRHPLSAAVSAELRRRLDVGPAPRGGNSYTLNNSGGGDNQTSGPSFRIIVDTGDWDRAVGVNSPGQAGNPDDPHYRDLFPLWARDEYFPVAYGRDRVEAVTERTINLQPEGRP